MGLHQDAVDIEGFYRRYARTVYPVYAGIVALPPAGVVLTLFGHWLAGPSAVIVAVTATAWWSVWAKRQLDNTSATARRAIDEAYEADIADIESLIEGFATKD